MKEVVNATSESCSNHIFFFEAGPTWRHQSRAVLYALSLLYCFVGLATITDLYMQAGCYIPTPINVSWYFSRYYLLVIDDSIMDSSFGMNPVRINTYHEIVLLCNYVQAMETIVQQTRKAVRYNDESGSEEVVPVRIWNPVIADITLLALGTSAPQISLAIIDAVQQLGQKTSSGFLLVT